MKRLSNKQIPFCQKQLKYSHWKHKQLAQTSFSFFVFKTMFLLNRVYDKRLPVLVKPSWHFITLSENRNPASLIDAVSCIGRSKTRLPTPSRSNQTLWIKPCYLGLHQLTLLLTTNSGWSSSLVERCSPPGSFRILGFILDEAEEPRIFPCII